MRRERREIFQADVHTSLPQSAQVIWMRPNCTRTKYDRNVNIISIWYQYNKLDTPIGAHRNFWLTSIVIQVIVAARCVFFSFHFVYLHPACIQSSLDVSFSFLLVDLEGSPRSPALSLFARLLLAFLRRRFRRLFFCVFNTFFRIIRVLLSHIGVRRYSEAAAQTNASALLNWDVDAFLLIYYSYYGAKVFYIMRMHYSGNMISYYQFYDFNSSSIARWHFIRFYQPS